MEIKKNETLGRPMLTKKVDVSVFVRTLVYEVRTAAQSVAGATARAGEDASASVGAGVEAATAAEMVLLAELVPVSEHVPVSMPDPPVDQPEPLTRSVPNPQLDQTELLPLSVLEQLPVLDLCETAAIVPGML